MKTIFERVKTKKIAILTIVLGFILSLFVLYTPMPKSLDTENEFSAIRAGKYIEEISRKPHSYYDREEHEEVKNYLTDTLKNMLGSNNVVSYNYTIEEVKEKLILENSKGNNKYNLDKVIYGVSNILGKIEGKSDKGIFLMAHYDSRGHVGRYGEFGRSYGAMDDGYGVGTMLELASLLKDEKPENSIYFLLTDAEEVDLYGSIMASYEKEIMDNNVFLINLESRGRYGASYMFETSNNNSKVIDLYKYAKYPVSYSMATAVYSVMPNFTDFSPFITKNIPGLNFATLAGLDNYHTPLDSYENINFSSIQHMGEQVLPIVREFMNDSKYVSNDYFKASGNQVFFTLFAGVFVSYSKTFAIVLSVVMLALIALILVDLIRNKKLDKEIFVKKIPKGMLLLVLSLAIGILYSKVVAFIGKVPFSLTYTRVSDTFVPTFVLIALYVFLLTKIFNKDKTNNTLILGTIINVLLTLVTTFTLEGASFLFLVASIVGITGLLVDKLKSKYLKLGLLSIVIIINMLVIIPIVYSFYMALTVGGVAILLVLILLNLGVTIPAIAKQFRIN